MDISAALLDEIRAGRVVLFLGAGASLGACRKDGSAPPDGPALSRLLAARFLGGAFAESDLSMVAELSISERGLSEVQDYIRDQFADLLPADFHLLLPTFRWRGLATTNFDELIEEVYRRAAKPPQMVVPILSDRDRMDEVLRAPSSIGLLKLHGCISRTHDERLPLILTADQYATHRATRERLFRTFGGWAYDCTVIYVGHAMRDSDLRSILVEIAGDAKMRPPHYLVKPTVHPAEQRMWDQKRVFMLSGTFQEFLESLAAAIPAAQRQLTAMVDRTFPIQDHFRSREPLPPHVQNCLEVDFEHVHPALPIETATPRAFFRGFGFRWTPIVSQWDVRRGLTDTILLEVILRSEEDRPTSADFYAIKAEAGAGKSVFLRRLAWEAAQGGVLVLFLRKHGRLSIEPIRDLARLTGKRLFLFVDDASDNLADLRAFLDGARGARLPVTLITAERSSTWNTDCASLDDYLSEEFSLRYLNREEIVALLGKLEYYESLGRHLEQLPPDDRIRQFEEKAGRQLLVALHEATLGRPYEDILFDEFNEIAPQAARQIYLSVCVLNRFRSPVRAGLIARVHGVNFQEFRVRFLAPLEHVVEASLDKSTGDYYYQARHPEIAQIVFERVLRTPADRFNEISRVLAELNVSYSSDLGSFRQLIRARALAELFPSREDVQALFEIAERSARNEAFLWQQRAIYEKNRQDGSLARAAEWLKRARHLDPRDSSITHSLAELAREQALRAAAPLEREQFRREARALAESLLSSLHHGRFARHTLAKLSLDSLRDLLADPAATNRILDEAMRAIEGSLFRALQEYPDDPYLLTADADFRRIVRDDAKALEALQAANKANPRDAFIASRLASVYEDRGENSLALDVLREALSSHRGDRQLNFRFARMLQKTEPADPEVLLYHFRRAFAPGDKNYEAQFWFARFAFESEVPEAREDARRIFRELRGIAMAHDVRIETKDIASKAGRPQIFTGSVVKLEEDYGFIQRDGLGDEIFAHRREQAPDQWARIAMRVRVAFQIGYSFAGVKAISIQVIA